MNNFQYSMTEIENLMPWEREIYIALIMQQNQEKNSNG